MGIFRQFPYTNFHEINLDEIIKIMRELQEEWGETETEWASYKDFIDNYFENLDVSDEVLAALRIMASGGELDPIIDPVIVTEVIAWLNDHITQPTTPAIDTSLTVAGAAADSKAVGDKFTFNETEMRSTNSHYEYISDGTDGSYMGVTYSWHDNYCYLAGTTSGVFNVNIYADSAAFPGSIKAGDILTFNIENLNSNFAFEVFYYVGGSWTNSSGYSNSAQGVVPATATGMLIRMHIPSGVAIASNVKLYITKVQTDQITGNALPVVLANTGYDVKAVVEALLTKYGKAIFGAGTYLSSGIRMPASSVITGAGDATLLTSYNNAHGIVTDGNNIIENIHIHSNMGHTSNVGTYAGIYIEGNGDNSPFQGGNKISNVTISGFPKAGIYGTNTGYYVGNSMSVTNARIFNCYAGILLENLCEYNRFTNVQAFNNYVGFFNYSGNNVCVNCSFTENTVGVYLIGNDANLSTNNGHGALIGCTINHSNNNTGFGIICRGITNGFIFDSCHIWYSKVQVEDALGITFSNCIFGNATNTNNEIINWRTPLFILGCMFTTGATFTGTGGTNTLTACYNYAGNPVT